MMRVLLGCSAALLLAFAGTAIGDPIVVVDQQQLTSCCAQDIGEFGPLAQEFTPTLAGLDAVELGLLDVDPAVLDTLLNVLIVQGALGGPVVATSATVMVPDGTNGLVHFDFAATVPLVPGSVYLIQPQLVAGADIAWLNAITNPYPGGLGIFLGQSLPELDYVFIEGLHGTPEVAEPSTAVMLALGIGGLALQARRRSPAPRAARR